MMMTEKVDAPIGLSDAVGGFTYGSLADRGVIALAEQARHAEDEQEEFWNENPMTPHFDGLLAAAKRILAAADYLVAEVEAYDAKYRRQGAQ